MGFIAGILSGAQRLTHVAFLRADPMLCKLLAVGRIIASQSTLSRFFTLFSFGKTGEGERLSLVPT